MGRAWCALVAVSVLLVVPAVLPPEALGGTVGPVPTATARPAAAPMAASAPVRVRSAAIGLDSAMIPLGLDPAGALEVPPDGDATGWYTGGPAPGELGPAVLAAHVDWDHRLGPFAHLRALAPGDLVEVDRADGSRATFEVQAVRRYAKDRFPTDVVYGDLPRAGLRLVTCGGAFDRGARSYDDNVVAFAALVDT
ncbi:class F sortase [Pseudonocardia sediminis]|uniref:class F sortase n=1 Tax=Pseudonocardia sediminis TaxID=1397368 RepID=UPI001F5EA0B6|nr:class F sortase [Pseudonocardia sediminis]